MPTDILLFVADAGISGRIGNDRVLRQRVGLRETDPCLLASGAVRNDETLDSSYTAFINEHRSETENRLLIFVRLSAAFCPT